MTREQLTDFLTELTALSKKYKIVIGGCGCCGSPYVASSSQEEEDGCVYMVRNFNDTSSAEYLGICNSNDNDFDYMEPEELERVVQGRME